MQNTDRFLSSGREDLASFKEQIDRRVKTLETDMEFKLASAGATASDRGANETD